MTVKNHFARPYIIAIPCFIVHWAVADVYQRVSGAHLYETGSLALRVWGVHFVAVSLTGLIEWFILKRKKIQWLATALTYISVALTLIVLQLIVTS